MFVKLFQFVVSVYSTTCYGDLKLKREVFKPHFVVLCSSRFYYVHVVDNVGYD